MGNSSLPFEDAVSEQSLLMLLAGRLPCALVRDRRDAFSVSLLLHHEFLQRPLSSFGRTLTSPRLRQQCRNFQFTVNE
jgi:hypothetical protein